MKLTDLNPRWFAEEGRTGQGVNFDCPHCRLAGKADGARCSVAFSNPLDGGSPLALRSPRHLWPIIGEGSRIVIPPGVHWRRTGEAFDSLTLSPSVDASPAGHWHGWVNAGECR